MRRLWRLWKDRRLVRGKFFTIKITGHWWSPTDRRAAKIAVLLCDFAAEETQEETHRQIRDHLMFGESFVKAHFVPDKWPYPDEDPPDPL